MQVNSLISGYTNKLQDVTETESNKSETVTSDFEIQLKGMLNPDPENNVSEEELFAALMSERLIGSKGQEIGDKFNSLFESKKTEMQKSDGYVPVEDAAKEALRELRASGDLTTEEADKIYSQSFAAAQLDGNSDALFDGRGGAGDDTIAVSQLEQALLSARTITEKFDTAEESAEIRSLDEASNTKTYIAPALTVPVTEDSTEDMGEDDVLNASGNETLDDSSLDSIPELELALNFSKKILNKDLDNSLMRSLSKDKDKEKVKGKEL